MKKFQKGSSSVELLIYGVILIAFLLFGGAKAILYLATADEVVATVKDKGERCITRDSCKYMIYTNNGVFQNTDSWLNWKFDSADVYNQIEAGHTYKFKTNGIRFSAPFISWFPNISKVQEVK